MEDALCSANDGDEAEAVVQSVRTHLTMERMERISRNPSVSGVMEDDYQQGSRGDEGRE